MSVRILLPHHLQVLAGSEREVVVEVAGEVTMRSILDALEARYPELRGTIREHVTLKRRPRVRFFADGRDLSHEPAETAVPPAVAKGEQPFMIVGAVAGG